MIKKVFLVHHTHTDIGYTDLQTEVLKKHITFLDNVLEYCSKTDDYPEEIKFRWTLEVSWQLENYFQKRHSRIQEFIDRVKEGRIEITGLYLNMTDLFSLELLIRSLAILKEIEEKYGIKVLTAMNCDVNGLSWNIPQILNKMGIKYLLMATNEIRAFAPSVPRPFYWESPDGNKVLVWNAGRELWYGEGIALGFTHSYEKLKGKFPPYLKRLEHHYPYDAICLQVAMDNEPPCLKICEIIKEWNERKKFPEIIFSTPAKFFQYMERQYAPKFPVYKMAWPDWWADGNASCALETALFRNTCNRIIENEAIYTLLDRLKNKRYPGDKFNRIYRKLFFFAEHTFGSEKSIKKPYSSPTLSQWKIKSNFVYSAYLENERLYKEEISLLEKKFPDILVKKEGSTLQKKFYKEFKIENDFYRIEIDKTTGGIKSLYDKELKEELIDEKSHYKLNQYIFETIASPEGRNAMWDEKSSAPLWSPERKKTPLFHRYNPFLKSFSLFKDKDTQKIKLHIEGKGCKKIISEITLDSSEKKIEISNTLLKEENLSPEGVYFAFPFNFKNPEINLCGPGKAIFSPEKEQLPSTARDYYSIENWIMMRDEKKSIILVSPEAPLIQISGINTGKWLKKLEIENGMVFSYVMNNYWYTNFKATQKGKVTFHYFLTSQRRMIENSFAEDFSIRNTMPVFYNIIQKFFLTNHKNIIITCFKKSEDREGYILRLKEVDGKKTVLHLDFPNFNIQKIFLAKPNEEKIKLIPSTDFYIQPFEILTLYLKS